MSVSGIVKVVLYKHGMGYFERREAVKGNTEVRLGFRQREMDDVLKSLTVYDLDGGSVTSVSYDNQKPVERRLEDVPFDFPTEGGQGALLKAVRGARVKVAVGSREVKGQVVGVEQIQRRSADGVANETLLALMDDGGTLHNFELSQVSGINFEDQHILKDVKFYLDTLLSSSRRDTKNLVLHARGDGKRQLQISYVVECPVWKTSYRIALPEEDTDRPFLQGWALIDNPQDEDWDEVELSLVSGLPISFVYDLYTPRYLKRQRIEVEREASAGPVQTQAALMRGEELHSFAEGAPMPAMAMAAPAGAGGGGESRWGTAVADKKRQALSQVQAQTVTQTLGELFEYRIAKPVTVKRNQSALVPIVTSEFEGRRKVLYNERERAENPFSALDFKNTTGLTLEGGPVTIFDGDTYAGEAMLDTLQPDESRLVAFAVDLGCEVESIHDGSVETVNLVTAAQGRLVAHSSRLETKVYHFSNKSERQKCCVLEHPVRHGHELYNTPEPVERSRDFYRFEVALPPKTTTTFKVVERSHRRQTFSLDALNREQFQVWLQRDYVGESEAAELEEVITLVESLGKLNSKIDLVRKRIATVEKDQERLRKNLASLGSSHDEGRLRTRYVATLEQQENELDNQRRVLMMLGQECEKRREEVTDAILMIEFQRIL